MPAGRRVAVPAHARLAVPAAGGITVPADRGITRAGRPSIRRGGQRKSGRPGKRSADAPAGDCGGRGAVPGCGRRHRPRRAGPTGISRRRHRPPPRRTPTRRARRPADVAGAPSGGRGDSPAPGRGTPGGACRGCSRRCGPAEPDCGWRGIAAPGRAWPCGDTPCGDSSPAATAPCCRGGPCCCGGPCCVTDLAAVVDLAAVADLAAVVRGALRWFGPRRLVLRRQSLWQGGLGRPPAGPALTRRWRREVVARADAGPLLLGGAQVGEPAQLLAADLLGPVVLRATPAPATSLAPAGRLRPVSGAVAWLVGTAFHRVPSPLAATSPVVVAPPVVVRHRARYGAAWAGAPPRRAPPRARWGGSSRRPTRSSGAYCWVTTPRGSSCGYR